MMAKNNKNTGVKKAVVLGLILLSWLVPVLSAKTIWFNQSTYMKEYQITMILLYLLLNFYLLLKFQDSEAIARNTNKWIVLINLIFIIVEFLGQYMFRSTDAAGPHGIIVFWILGIIVFIVLLYPLFLSLNLKYSTNLYVVSGISLFVTTIYSLPLLLMQGGIDPEDIIYLVLSGPAIGTIIALIKKMVSFIIKNLSINF